MNASSTRAAGKVALVTGASRGIGRAIALRLAREGATVAVHFGNRADAARAVSSEIAALGGTSILVEGDLSTSDGIDRVVAAIGLETEAIDILVNNAGIQLPEGPSASEEAFDRLFDINVKAPFFLVQRLAAKLRDGGRIVNISSGLSRIAYPEKMVYGMTKAAINMMTKSYASHLGARGITVNAVLPGVIETDMQPWIRNPDIAREFAEGIALKRVGQPDDVADVVAFLVSEDARWMTGELVEASGGARLMT